MVNPWIIVGFLIALAAAVAGGYFKGESDGVTKQKVEDQAQFDAINKKLSDQKAEANARFKQDTDQVLALIAERDKVKSDLENANVKNQKITADLSHQLSARKLQFRAAEGPGCGVGGGSTKSPEGTPASASASSVVQLPDAVAGNLRQLALDADNLKDAYALCYGFVEVK